MNLSAPARILYLATALALASCAGSKNAFVQTGQGSYYADKFVGRPTASGVPHRASAR